MGQAEEANRACLPLGQNADSDLGPKADSEGTPGVVHYGDSESVSECITIIALVGNNRLGVWQHWIDQSRALMVTHLSFEKKDNWPASAIANRVQLGV